MNNDDVLDEIQKVIDEYIADTDLSATDAMESIIDIINKFRH